MLTRSTSRLRFEPLFKALFERVLKDRRQRRPHPPDRDRQAIGLELHLVTSAAFVHRDARDAGNLAGREVAELFARSGGQFHARHRQPIDLRPVL